MRVHLKNMELVLAGHKLDSKTCVNDIIYKPKSGSAVINTKGREKQSKNNVIRIVDNLPLNLRPKNSLEIKRRINEAATKKVEIDYTHLLL